MTTSPKPVCPLCLNRGHILINAGTGLTKKCPAKCQPVAEHSKNGAHKP